MQFFWDLKLYHTDCMGSRAVIDPYYFLEPSSLPAFAEAAGGYIVTALI